MKSIILSIFLLITIGIESQTIYTTFAPQKMGLGLLISQPIIEDLQLITSFDQGIYKTSIDCQISSVSINKFGFGAQYNKWLLIGQYNHLYNVDDKQNLFQLNQVHKLSFEIGFTMQIINRIYSGLLIDPINNEIRIIAGINLTKQQK